MYKICVFAGTTEGRELAAFLSGQPVQVTACVATEYGETLLSPADNLTISAKRMTAEEMEVLFSSSKFDLVVDATHPYAAVVTENIAQACSATDTKYLRLLRDSQTAPEDAVFVSDIAGAVEYLNTTDGNILLTTGSKELAAYQKIENFADRVYARVLPMDASLAACQQAGMPPAHIIAMQGPFSKEINVAMLRQISAKIMVTKETGHAGGFEEKADAAREAGAQLVVVGRPPQREGLSYAEVIAYLEERFGLQRKAKVTVVGIGPGSAAAMTEEVSRAIAEADCVIGAKRMLEAVADGRQAVCDAIAPGAIADFIGKHPEYCRFAIVMSGDVGFYSGAKKLLPMLSECEVKVLPGLSSLVYLCARLGTSYEDVVSVSIHGRDHDILPDIRKNSRIFVLVGGENGMGKLCQSLSESGFGQVKVSVGERLSYPEEKITVGTAKELADREFASLSVALIEQAEDPDKRAAVESSGNLPYSAQVVTCGLPDEVFLRGAGADGVVPMTKSEVRAVSLSKLQLTSNAVCWDVGAGTGSVSIEMALQAKSGHVYAIERKEAAAELLQENRRRFEIDNMTVVFGIAPEACSDLPAPTHAFIGGSSGNMKEIISLLLEKNPNVRIVATAISLESIAELTECLKTFLFTYTEVVSMSVAKDKKAGRYHLMTGQNPIYIYTMQKV